MHFSVAGLFIGTMFSAVGVGYFVYGRRQTRIVHLVCGTVLAVYPWFVTSLVPLIGIGLAFALAPFAAAWWFGL